ncbi:MAG: hypothetical protein HY832_00630 [Candidatus Aenigmarchaeota archaeon]|nr:hypothetical protein [Candidatus Aenigmarchaeota archaeon]
MKNQLNEHKVGLILGLFLAVLHAVWSLAIALGSGMVQTFMDWIFQLHSLQPVYVITTFNPMNTVLLVVATFVGGYVFGWIFAACWNWIEKSKW